MIGSARQVFTCRAAHWGAGGEGGGDRLVPSSLSLELRWWWPDFWVCSNLVKKGDLALSIDIVQYKANEPAEFTKTEHSLCSVQACLRVKSIGG